MAGGFSGLAGLHVTSSLMGGCRLSVAANFVSPVMISWMPQHRRPCLGGRYGDLVLTSR